MSTWMRLVCVLMLCLAAIPAAGQGEPPQVSLDAVKVTAGPKLDGVLDDECWKSVPEITGFIDAQTRALARMQTKAWICYDDANIYVAFHAYHPDPKKIKAEETKRNGTSYWTDDFVTLFVDSRHAHRGASAFKVTARGTQIEELERSSSQNIEYKGDWRAAAKMVDDGYIVEMAIPFSLLLYANGQDTFGIAVGRDHSGDRAFTAWPDLNGNGDTKYYCHWKGLKPPSSRPRPQLLGYAMGQSGADEMRTNYQGLDIKYPFSPDSLGVLSLNPDFYSVEQQVESIDFSYTERYLDDARPFFNEWALPVDERVFYSRRIADFDTGAKFAANSGPNSYGFMTMRTPGEQTDTVASFSHNIGNKSGMIVNLAEHSTPGHRNLVSYYRGRIGFEQGQRTHRLTGGIYDSSTTGLPGGQSSYVSYSTYGADGDIGFYYEYGRTDPTFNGEIGYNTDLGIQGSYWQLSREKVFRGKYLQYVQIQFNGQDADYTDGRHYNSNQQGYIRFDYADGRNLRFGYMHQQHESFDEALPFFSFRWNRYSLNRDGGLSVSWGRRAGGRYRQHWLEQKFRIGPKIALGIHWEREIIDSPSPYADIVRQTVATVNYDLNSEQSLGGRIVASEGERNVFFMYRQQVRHGTDAYLIYGDPNADSTSNRVTLKLVRVL